MPPFNPEIFHSRLPLSTQPPRFALPRHHPGCHLVHQPTRAHKASPPCSSAISARLQPRLQATSQALPARIQDFCAFPASTDLSSFLLHYTLYQTITEPTKPADSEQRKTYFSACLCARIQILCPFGGISVSSISTRDESRDLIYLLLPPTAIAAIANRFGGVPACKSPLRLEMLWNVT